MDRVVVFLLVALATLVSGEGFYKGYKVYDVTANTSNQQMSLKAIMNSGEFDFWNNRKVMVKPEEIARFEELMKNSSINFSIFHDDLDKFVKEEREENQKGIARSNGRFSFDAYHRYDVILEFLDEIALKHPSLVKVTTIAISTEGRPVKAVRLSTGGSGKPVIVMDAAIHAREWLAPTTVLYLIEQLVGPSKNLLDKVDWFIIPVLNVDGYEYSHTTERFWRKTRSKNSGTDCFGTDGNRNFDFHWMESGATDNPCSETYAGNKAFSEPETRGLRDVLLKENVKLYLAMHTSGELILYPWGYINALPDNWKDLDNLGRKAASAIQAVGGTRYTVGMSTEVLYAAAGASDDYAYAVGKSPYSYTVELPGNGFNPPPSIIKPVCLETMAAFTVFGNFIAQTYG